MGNFRNLSLFSSVHCSLGLIQLGNCILYFFHSTYNSIIYFQFFHLCHFYQMVSSHKLVPFFLSLFTLILQFLYHTLLMSLNRLSNHRFNLFTLPLILIPCISVFFITYRTSSPLILKALIILR